MLVAKRKVKIFVTNILFLHRCGSPFCRICFLALANAKSRLLKKAPQKFLEKLCFSIFAQPISHFSTFSVTLSTLKASMKLSTEALTVSVWAE